MRGMHEDMCVYTLCLVSNCNTWLSCALVGGSGLVALPVLMFVGSVMMGELGVIGFQVGKVRGVPSKKVAIDFDILELT